MCYGTPAVIQALQKAVAENPQLQLTLDLPNKQVRWEANTAAVEIPQGAWQMLVQGTWDATGQLLAAQAQIQQVAASLPYVRWQRAR